MKILKLIFKKLFAFLYGVFVWAVCFGLTVLVLHLMHVIDMWYTYGYWYKVKQFYSEKIIL